MVDHAAELELLGDEMCQLCRGRTDKVLEESFAWGRYRKGDSIDIKHLGECEFYSHVVVESRGLVSEALNVMRRGPEEPRRNRVIHQVRPEQVSDDSA